MSEQYVTEADLSIPLGKPDPQTGERPRIKRLYDIRLDGGIPLPWPMTPGGARVYVLIFALGSLTAVGVALWVGFSLFEPSPVRLLPALVTLLAIRYGVTPALHAYGRRPGMDRRTNERE